MGSALWRSCELQCPINEAPVESLHWVSAQPDVKAPLDKSYSSIIEQGIQTAILQLKKNKAPGRDKITAEILCQGSVLVKPHCFILPNYHSVQSLPTSMSKISSNLINRSKRRQREQVYWHEDGEIFSLISALRSRERLLIVGESACPACSERSLWLLWRVSAVSNSSTWPLLNVSLPFKRATS